MSENNTSPGNNGTPPYSSPASPPTPPSYPQHHPFTQPAGTYPSQPDQYPPSPYQYRYQPMDPWTLEGIRQAKIRTNNMLTVLAGVLGMIITFPIIGIGGAYFAAAGSLALMFRSMHLGGSYVTGLVCTVINLAIVQLVVLIFGLAFLSTGMSLGEFMEAAMAEQ